MKRNILSLFLVLLATGFLPCQNAGANIIFADEFVNYLTGPLGSPGTGLENGWYNPINSITVTNGSGSLDGTALGLVLSYGDRVFISPTNNYNNAVYNRFVNAGTYPGNTTTNISLYYSFLYKFHSDVPVDSANGIRVIQVNKENSGYTSSGNVTHFFLIAKQVSAGKVQLGICKEPGQVNPAVTNWASTNINYEDTFFVVIKNKTSGTTSNEVDSLWINPPTNSFGAAEGSVPTPNAVVADGSDDTSTTGQGRFFIDSCGQHAEFDELRIGNTWADVAPGDQCLAPVITGNPPLNITNVEGLNASFQVLAPCTNPNYQWQINPNGMGAWTDIPGAIFASYTTPTLWIATDQHNMYRCIVSSGCNPLDTPATSTACTVTLTTATYTPVGLVMYDNFTDTFRGNPPVTTNNSVWFTSSQYTDNLDASTGALIATPVSGSSTLWWCIFENETNGAPASLVPVTLNVTNAIKVTLPFTLGDMTAFTNNGALRFGVFDYADAGAAGGTIFTADTNACGGSSGNGVGVRGYVLSADFGTNFTANSPLSLLVRNGLSDLNLIGTTGDYISMDSGPSGGGYTNAPAFKPNTAYTLVLQVTRTDTNRCRLSATISGVNYAGVSTNWSFSNVDTNGLAYHRFDTFAIRPNKLENAADTFTFPYFEVQVVPTTWEIESINPVTVSRSGNSAILNWTPIPTGVASFSYSVQKTTQLLGTNTVWTLLTTNLAATTYTDTGATAPNSFYRVHSP